jgi:hypothetical protein
VLPQEKKFLLFHLRGRRNQLSILDPFGGNQFAGDFVNLIAAPADHYDLQTIVFVQMNVQAGIHGHMSFMLHLGQEIAQVVHPVIV